VAVVEVVIATFKVTAGLVTPRPDQVTVILVVPTAFPAATPSGVIVAIFVSELVQVKPELMRATDLSE